MAAARFFVDTALAVGDTVPLPADVTHHAKRVLRLRDGEPIVLFNGRGGEHAATLQIEPNRVLARLVAFDPVERESPLALTLIQALVAGEKLDWIVEKAVELGAQRIIVAPMRRGAVRLDDARRARRQQHLREVARAACCQCGRNRVPDTALCATLDEAIAATANDALRLMLLPAAVKPLPTALSVSTVTLLVGPEGGFDIDEQHNAERAGFASVHLGPRILRTETAGLAALAALQATRGDLAAPSP